MRISKALCSAVIGAALLMACLDVGTASAEDITLCTTGQYPCQAANRYEIVKAESSRSVLSRIYSGGEAVSCHSAIKLENSESTGWVWKMTEFSWSGCTKSSTTTLLPSISLEPLGEFSGNGNLKTISNSQVVFEGLPLGVKCTMTISEKALSFSHGTVGTEGTATLSIAKTPVTFSGLGCNPEKETRYWAANGETLAGLQSESYKIVSAVDASEQLGSAIYMTHGEF